MENLRIVELNGYPIIFADNLPKADVIGQFVRITFAESRRWNGQLILAPVVELIMPYDYVQTRPLRRVLAAPPFTEVDRLALH